MVTSRDPNPSGYLSRERDSEGIAVSYFRRTQVIIADMMITPLKRRETPRVQPRRPDKMPHELRLVEQAAHIIILLLYGL